MRMNRKAREELYDPKKPYCECCGRTYDPGWNRGRKNTLWNRVPMYRRTSRYGGTEDVRAHDRRTFDKVSEEQHKGSWLDFVKAHKNMRTKKGLLDLKAIAKLWKLKKAVIRKHE
jgi:hypothetical protein